jgi:hypothetical protein
MGSGLNGPTTGTDFRVFTYGFPSEASEVPSTGNGQYAGMVIGRSIGIGGSNVYTLSGTLNMTMDFAAKTYSGTITLSGTNQRTAEVVSLGSFPLTSRFPYPIPLNNIEANIGSNGELFQAKLGGKAAEELAGALNLSVADPRAPGVTLNIVGAVAARR